MFQLESEQSESKNNLEVLKRAVFTGFIGGVLWSTVGVISSLLNLIDISPRAFVVRPWLHSLAWTDHWQGDLLAILIIGLVSIIVAFLYWLMFRKISSMWVGVIYGVVLWALIFNLYVRWIGSLPLLNELSVHTIVGTICLYILYGLFIGFSISYDYDDTTLASRG